ncbi:MAG: MBL fold metallo-hydrolase [Geminicoccaceae bacterium]
MQTCFHVGNGRQQMLLDCGATVLLAMQQQNIDPMSVDYILLSHLHGDHFGGVPFYLLHAQFVAKRDKPLTILGPKGTERRITDALDILFPDLQALVWRFPIQFIELEAHREQTIGDIRISPHLVDHPSGAPSFAFRLKIDDKVLAFSGDTRWTKSLVEVADDVDLLIAECHSCRPNGIHHLDWQTLNEHENDLKAKRILLTHMSQPMLDCLPKLDRGRFEFAEDGLVTEL